LFIVEDFVFVFHVCFLSVVTPCTVVVVVVVVVVVAVIVVGDMNGVDGGVVDAIVVAVGFLCY